MFKELFNSLNNYEKEFIYNALEIENISDKSQSPFRFWFKDLRDNHNKRIGDIYEFGVYRGSSLLAIALLAKKIKSNKHFWGFDTFSGFPNLSKKDKLNNFNKKNGFEDQHIKDAKLLAKIKMTNKEIDKENLNLSLSKLGKSGLFKNTSYDLLLEKIEKLNLKNITLIKGDFKKTVYEHFEKKSRRIFSANLDCDLYEGYKLCLPIVFNNLEKGGFLNLDEYYSLKYPGAKIATDEFLQNNKKALLRKNNTRHGEFERYYITKL